jgi:16S rRNA (cytosine967-C5)-methyltransferase
MSTQVGTRTRALAIDALVHVLTRNQHADAALDKLFEAASKVGPTPLRALDRAFVFEILYGTLRWLGKIDWILTHMVNRPMGSLDPRVLCALRVGTYQIFYMDRVPDRAAVSETVEAVKKVGAGPAASFVNAILRRVSKKAEYFPKPDKETQTAAYLAMHFSHPQWMIERWMLRMGPERLEHMLAAQNVAPPVSLRVIDRNMNKEDDPHKDEDLGTQMLREHGLSSQTRPLKGALRLTELPPFKVCPMFKAGKYMVQDEAAQLTASLVKPLPSQTVLDACSAPGGKAIFLWAEGLDPKNLTLCDSSQKRILTMVSNLERVGLKEVRTVQGDLAEVLPQETFDKVLLDAPCSSFGVIRRHPEIKWLRSLADVTKAAAEQKRLMDAAAAKVKPGGELIYVVCSQELEETSEVTTQFLKKHPEFERVSLDGKLHDYYKKYVTSEQELLVFPGNSDSLDGFFAAVFKRTSP